MAAIAGERQSVLPFRCALCLLAMGGCGGEGALASRQHRSEQLRDFVLVCCGSKGVHANSLTAIMTACKWRRQPLANLDAITGRSILKLDRLLWICLSPALTCDSHVDHHGGIAYPSEAIASMHPSALRNRADIP